MLNATLRCIAVGGTQYLWIALWLSRHIEALADHLSSQGVVGGGRLKAAAKPDLVTGAYSRPAGSPRVSLFETAGHAR